MAEYLELDPTLVRILWILSAFFGGFTILLYIILAFVMPLEPGPGPAHGPWQPAGPAWGAAPSGAVAAAGSDPTFGSAPDQGGAADVTAGDPGAGTQPGAGMAGPAWQVPWHDERPDGRRGGRGGLYVGVLLVVFGAFALANAVIPGWAGVAWFGPALLVGLGLALLAGSFRRPIPRRLGSASAHAEPP